MEYTLQQLKEIATKLNLDYHPNIGITKLTEKIAEQAEEMGTTIEEVASTLSNSTVNVEVDIKALEESLMDAPKPTTSEIIEPVSTKTVMQGAMTDEIERLKHLTFANAATDKIKKNESVQIRDAKKLVRVIINCNNKNKAGYTGDIFSAHNAYVSETKFIPFGTPTHITQIMFNTLKEKKCQQFKKVKLPNGQEITRPYVIDEFNIEILPPLTKDELEAIKKKQLAEGFTGE